MIKMVYNLEMHKKGLRGEDMAIDNFNIVIEIKLRLIKMTK